MSRHVEAWHALGEPLSVPGTAGTRIWRQGDGPPVVCLHGVPSSAYLYRKVLPELAGRGLEGVALDFPGMGFADRPHPRDFDYSWTGLAAWLERALTAAGLDRVHLVVHDIAGPIGFDLIRRSPGRIRSLTVLDTMVRVSRFRKPWVMRPFSVPVVGRAWVAVMDSPLVVPFFRWKGSHRGGYGEIRAYGRLLARRDGGRAFRAIMAGFENDAAFEARTLPALEARSFPAQVVWGRDDAELTVAEEGEEAREVLGLERVHTVHGKHF
ncbi:MAG: alpha/beta fold hydrolase, partial [Longimicrobiales bacterium]|nr:alpha/beta fold hydrolase [Longimicrobiales bacterium]